MDPLSIDLFYKQFNKIGTIYLNRFNNILAVYLSQGDFFSPPSDLYNQGICIIYYIYH